MNDFFHFLLPPPVDMSKWIFMATYLATITCMVHVLRKGLYFSGVIFTAYAAMLFLRSITMILVPLDPPLEMIPLTDPLLSYTNPSGDFVFSKDLFFSGHTASMFFFFFVANEKRLKTFYFLLSMFVIVAISIQRIHYTVDIAGGIIAAYFAFSLSIFLEKRLSMIRQKPVIQKLYVAKSVANLEEKRPVRKSHPQT